MTLDQIAQERERLVRITGKKHGLLADVKFSEMYERKHGNCLEYMYGHSDDPQAYKKYTTRQLAVYKRYVRREIYRWVTQ